MIYFIQTAHENATNRRCTKNAKNTWKLLLTFLCESFYFWFAVFVFFLYFCCFYYGSFNCWGPLRLLKCFYLILCVVQVHGPLKNKKEHKKLPYFRPVVCTYVCVCVYVCVCSVLRAAFFLLSISPKCIFVSRFASFWQQHATISCRLTAAKSSVGPIH